MAGLGGVLGTIIGWLGYQVGQRADTADSGGTLHSKVVDAKSYLVNTITPKLFDWKDTDAMAAKVTSTNATYIPVVNIAGAGFLTGITAWPHGNVYSAAVIKVTVDGVLKFTDFQIAEQIDGSPDLHLANSIPMFLRFKTSLLVEAHSVSDGYSTDCDILATYLLD